jgi:hypothetical protein
MDPGIESRAGRVADVEPGYMDMTSKETQRGVVTALRCAALKQAVGRGRMRPRSRLNAVVPVS